MELGKLLMVGEKWGREREGEDKNRERERANDGRREEMRSRNRK